MEVIRAKSARREEQVAFRAATRGSVFRLQVSADATDPSSAEQFVLVSHGRGASRSSVAREPQTTT